MIRYVGNCEFEDCCEPFASKNEFGVDVLQRRMRGRADKLHQFIASLRQGAPLAGNGSNGSPGLSSGQSGGPVGQSGFRGPQGFYLQTWYADDHPVFPTVLLTYKGLLSGAVPNPKRTYDTQQKTISITATVSGEERTYDVLYHSPTLTVQYVTNSEKAPIPSGLSVQSAQVINSVYTDLLGRRRQGFPPNLALVVQTDRDSRNEIYGTPYFECECVLCGVIQP